MKQKQPCKKVCKGFESTRNTNSCPSAWPGSRTDGRFNLLYNSLAQLCVLREASFLYWHRGIGAFTGLLDSVFVSCPNLLYSFSEFLPQQKWLLFFCLIRGPRISFELWWNVLFPLFVEMIDDNTVQLVLVTFFLWCSSVSFWNLPGCPHVPVWTSQQEEFLGDLIDTYKIWDKSCWLLERWQARQHSRPPCN